MEKGVVATNVCLKMKKSQSFHIITKGELTQKGDFIGFDTNYNSIFISKNTKLIKTVDDISEDSPLFCFAKVDELFNKNIDGKKIHFLKGYFAEFDLIKMLTAITDDFVVEFVHLNENQVDNFIFLKSILDEFNLFKEKKQLLKTKKDIGFNRSKDELNYELPFLLLSSGCFELRQKLDKYINFYAYEKEINFNNDDEYLNFNNCEKLFGLEKMKNYVFKIDLVPLYPSIKIILNGINKPDIRPFQKIITKESLMKFDYDKKRYFDQFFKLTGTEYDPKINQLQYYLENPLLFKERLKSKFDTLCTYIITPMITKEQYYKNTSFEELNRNLVEITTYFEKLNILNVIVLPPQYIYSPIEEGIDYYLNRQNEDINNTYDGWAELGDQEMNRMDEETHGFWRY
jgi:hypothetical protein